jgi:urease accessory protein
MRLKPRTHFATGFAIAIAIVATGVSLFSSIASAHTGLSDAGGFAHGFMHPLSGLDHLLAMVMVGNVLAINNLMLPATETMIALSVVGLGALLATGLLIHFAALAALTGFFALFHGLAHGAEIPADATGLGMLAGLV